MEISEFKENTFNSIFRHGNSIVGPISIVSIINMMFFGGLIYFLFVQIFNVDLTAFENLKEPILDPEEAQQMFIDIFSSIEAFWTAIAIFYLVLFIFGVWTGNLMLNISKAKLEKESSVLNVALSRSFGGKLTQLFIASFYIIAGYMVVTMAAGALTRLLPINFAINILIAVVVFLFLLRTIVVFPAIIHGNMNAMDALRFSFKNISMRRSFIIFIIGISVSIMLAFIMGIFGGFLSILGSAGGIALFIFLLAFYCFINAYTISALTGFYFRFADFEHHDEASHLVE